MNMFANQDEYPAADCIEAPCPSFHTALGDKANNIDSVVSSKRNSQLLRLFRVQSATIYLLYTIFVGTAAFSILSLAFTSPLIYWDLIGFACARNRFSTIPLEVTLLLEFAFFGLFLYLDYGYFMALNAPFRPESKYNNDRYIFYIREQRSSILGAILSSLVMSVGTIYIYLDIHAYPTYRRYKRDYRKIKPRLVFTETGNPVAVFPPSEQSMLQRLSVDSLQEISAGAD
ncbi:hypothetical protein F4803DRAFT_533752 [Xylaria telfairii]|nr:hypothetical protein F4803DRAFT_533752 [Xylaria telfairii]